MQAIRFIKTPRDHQVVVDLPPGMAEASRVEVIVLSIDERVEGHALPGAGAARRRPSPRLSGTQIKGAIMAPAVPAADWASLA